MLVVIADLLFWVFVVSFPMLALLFAAICAFSYALAIVIVAPFWAGAWIVRRLRSA